MALKQRDRDASPDEVKEAKRAITRLTRPTFRHANCLNSYLRFYQKDPVAAEAFYQEAAKKYLESYTPSRRRAAAAGG